MLDVHALLARVETRDDSTDDTVSSCVEVEKKEVCKLDKPIEKTNDVGNEDIEKVLMQLVGVVMEVGFLLECVIFLVFSLDRFSY